MRKLTNMFQFAINDDHSEVTINFYEVYPIIPEKSGSPIKTESELVTSLVMSEDTAKGLAKMLLNVLENQSANN